MLTTETTDEFSEWLEALKDTRAKAKILARIDRLEGGNFGDVKPVGDGISEMRIHYGPGYRLHCCHRGKTIVLLLCGGDKDSQTKDIERAKKLKSQLEG